MYCDWASEQFLNATSAHYRLSSATNLEVIKSRKSSDKKEVKNQDYRANIKLKYKHYSWQ